MSGRRWRSPLTETERHCGLWLLLLFCFVAPLVLGLLFRLFNRMVQLPLNVGVWNLLYYLGFLLIVGVLFRRFLERSLWQLLRHPGPAGFWLCCAALLELLLEQLLRPLLTLQNGNTQQLAAQTVEHPLLMLLMTVVLAPVVEEMLFRGVLFGTLCSRSRALAYGASVLLFCLAHVWQQVIFTGEIRALTLMLEYLAPAIAFTFCYEKSNMIWVSILFHAGSNLCAVLSIIW